MLGLTQRQIARFYQLSDRARRLGYGKPRLGQRLLSAPGFGREQADSFYSYANETRLILLGLEDVPLVALLLRKSTKNCSSNPSVS